jgi:hypothetical protein
MAAWWHAATAATEVLGLRAMHHVVVDRAVLVNVCLPHHVCDTILGHRCCACREPRVGRWRRSTALHVELHSAAAPFECINIQRALESKASETLGAPFVEGLGLVFRLLVSHVGGADEDHESATAMTPYANRRRGPSSRAFRVLLARRPSFRCPQACSICMEGRSGFKHAAICRRSRRHGCHFEP